MASSSGSGAPAQPTSAEDILRRASYSTSGPSQSSIQAPTSESILSAYSSPSGLHPLSNVSADLDYLALDDAALSSIAGSQSVLPNRGWSDELCYGTGTVYVSGLAVGGLWGLREGWARSKAIAATRMARSAAAQLERSALGEAGAAKGAGAPGGGLGLGAAQKGAAAMQGALGGGPAGSGGVSWRLRLNAILNGITRRGSFTGNTCGVLALMYNAFNCTIDRYRGHHDTYNSVMAGGLTGALFRCTAGIQRTAIASSLMAGAAYTWSEVKPHLI